MMTTNDISQGKAEESWFTRTRSSNLLPSAFFEATTPSSSAWPWRRCTPSANEHK
jgi:hypothetical protein